DLGLRVDIGWHDLVTLNPALLVNKVDGELGANHVGLGATTGERACFVKDHADPEFLALRERVSRHKGQHSSPEGDPLQEWSHRSSSWVRTRGSGAAASSLRACRSACQRRILGGWR